MGEVLIKGQAKYLGGHFLYPPNNNGDSGNLTITENEITFEKTIFFIVQWKIQIPIKKIFWEKVTQNVGEDTAYKQKMTAITYMAGYGPVTSYSRNATFITIPYKDENNVEQNPKFLINNHKILEKVSKFIYEKMTSKKIK